MAGMKILSLEDAIGSLARRPGIAIGPAATCDPGTMSQILSGALRSIVGNASNTIDLPDDFRTALDTLAEKLPEKVLLVEREIRERIRILKTSLDLPYLAKAGWSACISLTDDVLFESALRTYFDSVPSSRTVTVIDSASMLPPERTLPVYKLLGNVNNNDPAHTLVLSESALLLRQQTWSRLLQTCPDYLREAPLFFIGTSTVTPMARIVLSTLLAMPHPNVTKVLFLKDDPTLNDSIIRALCNQCNAAVVDASLRELCSAIAELKEKKELPRLFASSQMSDVERGLFGHTSLVSVVPSMASSHIDIALHLPALLDGLFRPSAVDWNPFLAGIDLRRTLGSTLKESVLELLKAPVSAHHRSLVVHGEAGIGKTTLLKRVAVDLATEGVTVLWCRRTSGGGWIRKFKALAADLAELAKGNSTQRLRLAVFCDDPWSLHLDAAELMDCFDRFLGPTVFVFAVRNSDYFAAESSALAIGSRPSDEMEVPFDLDGSELKDLGLMLERIGAVKDAAEAQKEIARVPSHHSTDILCSLWYLVPETRSQLTESLRDEYCRLGNIRESLAMTAQEISRKSAAAHQAYEFVTVTSNLGIGLPIEVLVRALKIRYDEWLDMTVNGRPLWGLLYDEQDPENQTIVYRTRNEIITRVLMDLVNGGVGHVGEVRVLKDLLNACNIGSSVYRNFVVEVLVRNRSKLGKTINYEEGLELFDIARKSLPHEDRLLEHHMGIWIDDVGRDTRKAYAQLERALQTEVYPGSDRETPLEHIHTSMASTVVKMVKLGQQDRITGFELVRDHLRRASSATFFNAHTAHVAANLLFELSQQNGKVAYDTVGLTSISDAFHEIERAFQLIGAHGRSHSRNEKSIVLLTDLQRKILASIPDPEELKSLAESLFEQNGTQAGFEVAARRMLANAAESGKGSAFNSVNDYLRECIQRIESKGKKASAEILAVRIDLIIRWRIQKFKQVDWVPLVDDLKSILETPRYRDDVIKRFYYAVSLFHSKRITEANAVFASLRRLQLVTSPREIRCYYLGEHGNAMRLQGTLDKKHGYSYVVVPELELSVPTRSPATSIGSGSVVHAYVGFTLNGPSAVFDQPNESDYLLP